MTGAVWDRRAWCMMDGVGSANLVYDRRRGVCGGIDLVKLVGWGGALDRQPQFFLVYWVAWVSRWFNWHGSVHF